MTKKFSLERTIPVPLSKAEFPREKQLSDNARMSRTNSRMKQQAETIRKSRFLQKKTSVG